MGDRHLGPQRINTPLIAPMSKPYPVPPQPLKSSGALLQKAAAKLGLTRDAQCRGHHHPALYGRVGLHQLRHVLGL